LHLDDKKKNELQYASANLSIYVKSNGVAKELKGDIFSIGGGLGSSGKMFQTKSELLNLSFNSKKKEQTRY